VPIGRFSGIAVRVSLLYVVWMALQVGTAASQGGALGFGQQLFMVGALFVLVLLHEFGHCVAARRVGGDATDILMWPLGGLASCSLPHTWWAHFVTTAGGPLVNAALVPVLGGVLLVLGQPTGALVFSPLNVSSGWLALDYGAAGVPVWALQAAFWAYVANWALLLFNVLVPMFPMDGGRLLQAIMWRGMGFRRSMDITTRVGLFAAVVLGLFALTTGAMVLFAVAVMGGLTCYAERQRLAEMGALGAAGSGEDGAGEEWKLAGRGRGSAGAGSGASGWTVVRGAGGGGQGGDGGWGDGVGRTAEREAEKARKRAEVEQKERAAQSAELDRILAKIKDRGMSSLTGAERNFLSRTREKMQER
jgi:Zn-dependent protease